MYSCTAEYEKELKGIWKKKPCHVVQAKIDNFSIHLGSFHSLKPGGLLNDITTLHAYNTCTKIGCIYAYNNIISVHV